MASSIAIDLNSCSAAEHGTGCSWSHLSIAQDAPELPAVKGNLELATLPLGKQFAEVALEVLGMGGHKESPDGG